jgi:methionine synthase II (cobalamin-independent)
MTAFRANCYSTAIGSFPHDDPEKAVELILKFLPDIPVWPQLPKYVNEGMLRQYSNSIPGFIENEGKIYIDTTSDNFQENIISFYESFIRITENDSLEELENFALDREHARGIKDFIIALKNKKLNPIALKGHVTGPFTLTTSLSNQNHDLTFYDDGLRDLITKNLALKAKWQINLFSKFNIPVIIFIDEPSMVSYGSSSFIGISENDVKNILNEVINIIKKSGGIAGIHCCENTDWALVMDTGIDILSFDAYNFFDKLIIYKEELKKFLLKGNTIAWGIVPTQKEALEKVEIKTIISCLESQFKKLSDIGIENNVIFSQSLITPSCGLGSLTPQLAEKALHMTHDVSLYFRKKFKIN